MNARDVVSSVVMELRASAAWSGVPHTPEVFRSFEGASGVGLDNEKMDSISTFLTVEDINFLSLLGGIMAR